MSYLKQDTRGYIDIGPSCSECGTCECENCTEPTHGYVPRNRTPVPACQCEDCENLMYECVGLSVVYINLDDGSETLCNDCFVKMKVGV